MCCLGFLAETCEIKDVEPEQAIEIIGAATPSNSREFFVWPFEVVNSDGHDTQWTSTAIGINDDFNLEHEDRKKRLTEHFAKIGIELTFVP